MHFLSASLLVLATAVQATRGQGLTVDLGYEKYTGVSNDSLGLNIWKGIRYAAPPTGNNRFRAPQAPARTGKTILADKYGPLCFQANYAGAPPPSGQPTLSEDCLTLNIWAPKGASKLPVFVGIHGGGYGVGNGAQVDPTAILTAKDEAKFIGVTLQYRLGAFGFLSSEDVKKDGVLNAGLLDQQFMLEWIQKNIHLFGGDRTRVTIFGNSAGAGSVMLQAMAYGGSQGEKLFKNGVAASPYLAKQYKYNEDLPTAKYNQFVNLAGCASASNKMQCLRGKDATLLGSAAANVSAGGVYGTYGFLPVTDGSLIQNAPSVQLLDGLPLNGRNLWVGNNADEGGVITPYNITNEAQLTDYLRTQFPSFSPADITSILNTYPQSAYASSPSNPKFATAGDKAPTTLDVASTAIGFQQRANIIYGEANFICPSYWLAAGFSRSGKTAYKYQYSVPVSLHAVDNTAHVGPPTPNQGPDFVYAWRRMIGAYVANDVPNVPPQVGNGNGGSGRALSAWPKWSDGQKQVNFNQTGGEAYVMNFFGVANGTQTRGAGLKNDFRVVDALKWEGGRGARCDFWKSVAAKVPM